MRRRVQPGVRHHCGQASRHGTLAVGAGDQHGTKRLLGFPSRSRRICMFRRSYWMERYSFVSEKRWSMTDGTHQDISNSLPPLPSRRELCNRTFPRCSSGRVLPASWFSPADTARRIAGTAQERACSRARNRSPDTSSIRRTPCRASIAVRSVRRRIPASGHGTPTVFGLMYLHFG